jgi:adenosine deaminase
MIGGVDLRALPKVELHRHLDGSLRLGTILELAEERGMDIGARSESELARKATITRPLKDLETVLRCFDTLQKVLYSFQALSRVTFENIEDAWRDGVKLLELRFAPAFISQGKNISNDDIIGGVLDGLSRGIVKYPIEVGLIGILPRSLPIEWNIQATHDLIKWRLGGSPHSWRICGFDLADGEEGVESEPFVPLVNKAREAGMGITIHSGENTAAFHIRRTLDLYKPARIGHGIKAWGDEALIRRLKKEDVLLELCPTSNWLTSSVASLESHPLPHLYRAGVPVSINSDDPNLMEIDLVNEYEVCRRHFGFTESDFRAINENTLAHSFLPEEVKRGVRNTHFRV